MPDTDRHIQDWRIAFKATREALEIAGIELREGRFPHLPGLVIPASLADDAKGDVRTVSITGRVPWTDLRASDATLDIGNLGLALSHMLPPATLDGRDVLRVGNTFFVGRSERTNREGIAALAAFAAHVDPLARVVAIDLLAGLLHLKCHASVTSEFAKAAGSLTCLSILC